MRHILGFLFFASLVYGQSGNTARNVVSGGTLPATCTPGQVFNKTGSTPGLHDCPTTNTWRLIASGGGGGPGGTTDGVCTDVPSPGAWAPTWTAGHMYCLSVGTYTVATAQTINVANVTIIGSGVGTVIQRTNAATDLFDWTGAGGVLKDVTLDTNGQSNGYLVALNANNFIARNVTVTGIGNNGTAVTSAWLFTSGGSNHRWENITCDSTAVNNCLHLDNTDANVSNVTISGFKADMVYDVAGSNHQGALGIYSERAGGTMSDISVSNVSIRAKGAGIAVYYSGTGVPPADVRMSDISITATANQRNPISMLSIFGCNRCQFSRLYIADGGFTHLNQGVISAHDMHDSRFTDFTIYATANSGFGIYALDTARTSFGPGFIGGVKSFVAGSLATSGWSASLPGLYMTQAAASAEEDLNVVHDIIFFVPPTFTSDVIKISCASGTSACAWPKIINNTIYGSGQVSAGTGIGLRSTGGTTPTQYAYVSGNHIQNIATGIGIDATTDNSFIDQNLFSNVKTLYSDASSTTRYTYQCHTYTLGVATTNFTVSTDGGAVVNTAVSAATTEAVTLFALPALGMIKSIQSITSTAWTAPATFTTLTSTIGDSAGSATTYTSSAYNLVTAVSATNFQLGGPLVNKITQAGSNVQVNLTRGENLNSTQLSGATDYKICWAAQ